jgi:hypothetical protein
MEVPSAAHLDEAWLQDRLAYEEQPDNAITVPVTTRKWDETVQKCREDLGEVAEKLRVSKKPAHKAEKWPEWRKRTHFDNDGYAWRRVRDRGQRLRDTHKAVCFRVSLGTYKRALSIVNALALAARARGFSVRQDREEGRIVFAGHNAEVQVGAAPSNCLYYIFSLPGDYLIKYRSKLQRGVRGVHRGDRFQITGATWY